MDSERELLRGNTQTLVLAVLRDGPLHGYAIAREIERRSGSTLQCREGTLYPTLHALERADLIRGEWRTEGARERKVYVLTPEGAGALQDRAAQWERFAAAVKNVIGGDENVEAKPGGRRRAGKGLLPRTEPGG